MGRRRRLGDVVATGCEQLLVGVQRPVATTAVQASVGVGRGKAVAYLVLTCCRAECRGNEPKMWTEVVKCRSSATAAMSAGSLM